MTQPIWIDCASGADVPPPKKLGELATGGHHVVLRFSLLPHGEKGALIGQLAAALPDFSVFDSGGGLSPAWITVLPVVHRERVLSRRAEVLRAIAEYRQACVELVNQYRAGTLQREWRADEHGRECRSTNARTGQVVEAPNLVWTDPRTLDVTEGRVVDPQFGPFVEWTDRKGVDPYFFAKFVKTTAGLESVAALIEHDFHDAERILEVVAAWPESGDADVATGRPPTPLP